MAKKTSLAIESIQQGLAGTDKPQSVQEIHKKLELVTLASRLSSWESKFVDYVMMGYEEVEALSKSGFSLEKFGGDENLIREFAHKTLKNYDVQRYMQSATEMYRFVAPKAISTITKIMNESPDEKTRLDAAKFIATEGAKVGGDAGNLPTKLVLKFVKKGDDKEEEKVIEGDLVQEQPATINTQPNENA